MITFFNVKRKETNDLMRNELKAVVVPHLFQHGFSGKLPSFRRVKDGSCQTLDIQFNRYGKSFAVNLSIVDSSPDFMRIPYDRLRRLRSQRLGTRDKRIRRKLNMDHWFRFLRGFIFYRQSYSAAARSTVALFDSEADVIYRDLLTAIERGVSCIHLEPTT